MAIFQSPLLHLLLLLLTPIIASASSSSLLKMLPEIPYSGRDYLYCDSWRFSVETNDAGAWQTIPSRCVDYVAEYMTGPRYLSDSDVVAGDSLLHAERVMGSLSDRRGGASGKDIWIFDVDETLLSNLPYYAATGYGSEVYNETSFNEWVDLARAPALPASLMLYNELKLIGFRIFLLTGRSEDQRNATEENLRFAGYRSWERLILRDYSDIGKTAVVYKSGKRALLESEGYKIHGSSGDQWSDLIGSPMATRSFKLPNPMYYIE